MHKAMNMQTQFLTGRQQCISRMIDRLCLLGGNGLEPARAIAGNAQGFSQFHQHDAAVQRFLTAQQISGGRFAGKTGEIHAGKNLGQRAIPDEYLITRIVTTRGDLRGRCERKAQRGKHDEHKQQEKSQKKKHL